MSNETWEICLEEVLLDFNILMTKENIKIFADILASNAQSERENDFDRMGGRDNSLRVDYQRMYDDTKSELDRLKQENDIFRKSVSSRRNCNPSDVWIENGSVRYQP